MPINPEKHLAFIHIPKTGGTFIEHAMGIHAERPDSGFGGNYNHTADFHFLFGRNLQHLGFEDLNDLLGNASGKYYWFSVIRNPQDRLVSIICHSLNAPEAMTSVARLLRVAISL
jgi:hypothetical protein